MLIDAKLLLDGVDRNIETMRAKFGGNPILDAAISLVQNIRDYIAAQPAVDAVPVVRCKDCKWYEPCKDCSFDETTGRRDHSKIIENPYGECHGQDFVFTEDGCLRVGKDDFCSYGERRSDG